MERIKNETAATAILAIVLAALALWAISCGGYSSPTTPSGSTTTSANVTVNVVSSSGSGAFSPNPVSTTGGQTLAFKNSDGTLHHMVADNGSWDAGDVSPGLISKTINAPGSGTVNYHCTIHPSMVGSITVN